MVSTGIGKRYADGQAILRQGEPAERLNMVLEGEVELVQERPEGDLPLARLPVGAIFGELAVLDNQVHALTARARGEVRVLSIDKRTLLRRFKEDPSFAVRILQHMVHRIRDLTAELTAHRQVAAHRSNSGASDD